MAFTYEPIATQSLAGAGSVSFTSIPSGYTDLYAVVRGVIPGAILKMQYNGDTASNYSTILMWGNGSGSTSTRYSEAWVFVISGGSGADEDIALINIQNYSNTTTYKTSLSRAGAADATDTTGSQLWRSTAAINRVDFVLSSSTFTNGTATLYGIKAA
jgi:hypothetical protein